MQDGAIAPARWPLDVANALRSAERRGRIAPADLVVLRTVLTSFSVEIVPVALSTALGVIEVALATSTPGSPAPVERPASRS